VKNVTMQQKVLAIFMAIMLSGSVHAAAPKIQKRGPISHAQAHKWLETHFGCEADIAQDIKTLVIEADIVIIEFLDHKGNNEPWDKHIERFNGVIQKIKDLENHAKKNTKNKKAMALLSQRHHNLEKVLQLVQEARQSTVKNTFGGLDLLRLGLNLKPIFEEFDNDLPASMTIEKVIKEKYGSANYLTLISNRLGMQ
jgi:hypothetical protein